MRHVPFPPAQQHLSPQCPPLHPFALVSLLQSPHYDVSGLFSDRQVSWQVLLSPSLSCLSSLYPSPPWWNQLTIEEKRLCCYTMCESRGLSGSALAWPLTVLQMERRHCTVHSNVCAPFLLLLTPSSCIISSLSSSSWSLYFSLIFFNLFCSDSKEEMTIDKKQIQVLDQ